MKKFLILNALALVLLAACGSAPLSDEEMANKYAISVQQYQDIKKAAEGMGMPVEGHLESLGFTAKQ